jgi:hypothetical protein
MVLKSNARVMSTVKKIHLGIQVVATLVLTCSVFVVALGEKVMQ